MTTVADAQFEKSHSHFAKFLALDLQVCFVAITVLFVDILITDVLHMYVNCFKC